MEEEPRSAPPAEIPPRALWAYLLAPTGVTVLAFLFQLLVMTASPGRLGLDDVVVLGLATLLLGTVVALACLPKFVRLLRARYRGRSLVFLALGYLFGQALIQLPLGYGGCALALVLGDRLSGNL